VKIKEASFCSVRTKLNEYEYFFLLARKPAHLHERKVAQKLGLVTILKNALTAGKLKSFT